MYTANRGWWWRGWWNNIQTVFDGWMVSLCSLAHFETQLISFWRVLWTKDRGKAGVIVQVSSAKQLVGEEVTEVTELTKRRKRVGLRGDPCGTPADRVPGSDMLSPTQTDCVRSDRKSDSQVRADCSTPAE